MRITNSSIARNYTSNLNTNLSRLNSSNMKVTTGRNFTSMAENTSAGVRSMTVRRNISQLEGFMNNAKDAQNKFDGAEKTIGQISTMAQDIYARFNYAINGTNSEQERDVISKEFEKLRDEILTSANGQYADRYMFGGTNTQSRPFTTNDAGELMYNGARVKDIKKDDPSNIYDNLLNDASYVDIGLGLTMNGSSQDVIPNSAFKNTINGLDFMGTGDNNLYDTINEIITALKEPSFDTTKAGALLDKVRDAGNHVNLTRTKMGSDTQYLEFTVGRLESENDNLIKRQDQLEFADPYEAIMDFEMQKYVYDAALQMGSRLLQPTIFSFIS